jgi:membrane protein implicated in regulation of membrane protease activity
LANSSGYKSEAGVSHKSLAKIIFSIVSNLFLTSFSIFLLIIIFILSSFISDLYLLNLYLESKVVLIKSTILLSLLDKIVKLFGNLGSSSHKNSIRVLLVFLLK